MGLALHSQIGNVSLWTRALGKFEADPGPEPPADPVLCLLKTGLFSFFWPSLELHIVSIFPNN